MSADLDALCKPPGDFVRGMFQIEKILAHVEDCLAVERQMIRDLTTALAEEDEELAASYRKMKPVDLTATLTDAFQFLHDMHAAYVVERQAAAAGRELYTREHEYARAAHSALAREMLARREVAARSGGQAA